MKIHKFLITGMFIATTAFAVDPAADVPKSYPLSKCVVSGEPLGEQGKPFRFTYQGTDVWFCCQSCKTDFLKDPAKYLKLLKEAGSKK